MLLQPDYDQALKRMLVRAHDGFVALVAPGLTWHSELSPELPAVKRQADLAWEVEGTDGRRGILHIELQTKPDARMGERMAEYALRLWRRDHRPARSVVVCLRPGGKVPQSPFVIEWMGTEWLRFAFDVIRLWQVPPERVLETPHYQLWPLASLMARVSAVSTMAVAEQIAAAPLPREERSELVWLLVSLAAGRLPTEMLMEALGRTQMLRDLVDEEALAKLASALARDKAMRKSIRLVLEGRFGPLDEELRTAIEGVDGGDLEELLTHTGTDTLDQLRARLGLI